MIESDLLAGRAGTAVGLNPDLLYSSAGMKASPKKKAATKPIGGGDDVANGMTERSWRILALTILIVGAVLRLYALELKPLHHDEGVNGFFLRRLANENIYHYDPANYHGPTLPYAARVSTELLGMNTVAVRLVPAVFGMGVLLVVLGMRRRLGDVGSLASAALLAVSPGAVFHSRYFIHEMLLVFFTLAAVSAATRYFEGRGDLWMILAALSLALMFATKETAIISLIVILLAALLSTVWGRLIVRDHEAGQLTAASLGGPERILAVAIASAILFAAVNVVLYSSFFSYWEGVSGALKTLSIWKSTGEQQHVHPWYSYLQWLLKEESPILIVAVAGTVFVFLRRHSWFLRFVALWAFGLFAAYSLVPYKTPWLTLNFLIPLALLAGWSIDAVCRNFGVNLAVAIAAIALIAATYQAVVLNYFRYDDESIPYVYAPTHREFLEMVSEIESISQRAGTGTRTEVAVMYDSYWPLPWYLQAYQNVSYFGTPTPTQTAMVVGSADQDTALQPFLTDRYVKVRQYKQRNGLESVLWVRRDVLDRPLNCP
ncbi:MAG: flippase activity-associated protein Agl23 [Acidobacteriota bacterium]